MSTSLLVSCPEPCSSTATRAQRCCPHGLVGFLPRWDPVSFQGQLWGCSFFLTAQSQTWQEMSGVPGWGHVAFRPASMSSSGEQHAHFDSWQPREPQS